MIIVYLIMGFNFKSEGGGGYWNIGIYYNLYVSLLHCMFSLISQKIVIRIPWKLASSIFKFCCNYPAIFMKKIFLFIKLDHLTCGKLPIMTLLYQPIHSNKF